MANQFSQIFSLSDLFKNERLKNKLPQINTKKEERQTSGVDTIKNQIFTTVTNAAKPFYKPVMATQSGNKIIISGDLTGNQDDAVQAIYDALSATKEILTWGANNADMLGFAMKEAEQNKRNNGINSKLYLRVQSMQQIEGMSKHQLNGLMENILENIVYGDDFPQTQKKFGVENMLTNSPLSYKQRKLRWKYKVGDV